MQNDFFDFLKTNFCQHIYKSREIFDYSHIFFRVSGLQTFPGKKKNTLYFFLPKSEKKKKKVPKVSE